MTQTTKDAPAHKALLLLGSNEGDSLAALAEARRLLALRAGTVEAASAVYTSPAWGFESQHDFMNQALVVTTALPPATLLREMLAIEALLGRRRDRDPLLHPTRPQDKTTYSDRTMDIDLILYDQQVLDTPPLQLPHPRMRERRFVLAPAAEVAPGWADPLTGLTVLQLLRQCPDPSPVAPLPAPAPQGAPQPPKVSA